MKNLPANAGDMGQEDSLEKEMVTHSRILAWEFPWTEEPDGLQSMGHKGSDMTEHIAARAVKNTIKKKK